MRGLCVPLLLTALTAGCASYRMTIEPPPTALPMREASQRLPLWITVESTYAPYVDGELARALVSRMVADGWLDAAGSPP